MAEETEAEEVEEFSLELANDLATVVKSVVRHSTEVRVCSRFTREEELQFALKAWADSSVECQSQEFLEQHKTAVPMILLFNGWEELIVFQVRKDQAAVRVIHHSSSDERHCDAHVMPSIRVLATVKDLLMIPFIIVSDVWCGD